MWSHLAEAALAKHHQEVEVGEFHAILVAIGVKPGGGVGRLALRVLAYADLSSLDERRRKRGTVLVTSSETQADSA